MDSIMGDLGAATGGNAEEKAKSGVMQGYLRKRGKLIKNWKNRWCVLEANGTFTQLRCGNSINLYVQDGSPITKRSPQ